MARDNYERFLARERRGLYESHYLKANAPDNSEAFWIKHNLLVPPSGAGIAEFWLIWFRRGEAPRVWKREVSFAQLTLDAGTIGLRGDRFELTPGGCAGAIGNARWRLALSGAGAPLFHFHSPLLYRGGFPKKKILTPAPNLVFDGDVTIGERTINVATWVGLRGHNWGSEHAYSYSYGGCNMWDDGATGRAVDGFTARVKIGGRLTPWLSALVFRGTGGDGEPIEHNRLRDMYSRGAVVEPTHWKLPYRDLALEMNGETKEYAGLRYHHPDGRESYCYNTKFAAVTLTAGRHRFTSNAGEHEVLYPEPLPSIALHPAADWSQAAGDYQSA